MAKPDSFRPHICFVSPNLYPILVGDMSIPFAGGAEVQQSFIARGLRNAGYGVSVVTGDFGQPNEIDIDGIRVIKFIHRGPEIPVVRYFHPRLTSVWRAMVQANADIYYQRCAGHLTAVVGLFARRYGLRFIYAAAHDLDLDRDRTPEIFNRRGGWRDRQLFFIGLRLADAIVVQHAGQLLTCRRYHRRNGVQISSCYAAPAGSKSKPDGAVLWVSSIQRWKRPDKFIELARSFPHLRFRMIGGPSAEKDGQAYFNEVMMAARAVSNVEFSGFVPYTDVEAHFNSAQLFVNTSDYEGFPNTFLQAWARGIPTVSFVDCGAREAGQTIGTIAKDMRGMTEAVQRLSTDRHEWQKEGERARRYFDVNHSVDVVIGHYDRLIRRLFDSRGRY